MKKVKNIDQTFDQTICKRILARRSGIAAMYVIKRGCWMLVTTATVSRCKDNHLVDHMTSNMLLKRNVAPHF